MVLAFFGTHRSETELREMCDCTIFGTSALNLVRAAQSLGFDESRKHTLTLSDVKELTEQGYFPIAYVAVALRGAAPDVHSLVVTSVSESELCVLDPRQGPVMFLTEEFIEMWASMNYLTIVIARSPETNP